uniref:Uncharacterized protein n=1 Tax=Cacopsylla melanoneura TaxID=428564 RepID=A0A8D8Z4J0_9HEMI
MYIQGSCWSYLVLLTLYPPPTRLESEDDNKIDFYEDFRTSRPPKEKTIQYDEYGAPISTKPTRDRPKTNKRTTTQAYTGPSTFCTRTNISSVEQEALFKRISETLQDKWGTSTTEYDDCLFEDHRFDDLTDHIRKNYHMKDAATNKYMGEHMYKATSDYNRDYTDHGSPMQMVEYYAEARYNHVTNRTLVPWRESYSIIAYKRVG